MLKINTDCIVSTLEHLLTIPSPVGYYEKMKPVLEQYAADRAKALQESARKERKKVIEEIRAEIRRRAAIEGYELVLDSSGMSTNDTSLVLYSIVALDITDKVLTELNRSSKAPAASK